MSSIETLLNFKPRSVGNVRVTSEEGWSFERGTRGVRGACEGAGEAGLADGSWGGGTGDAGGAGDFGGQGWGSMGFWRGLKVDGDINLLNRFGILRLPRGVGVEVALSTSPILASSDSEYLLDSLGERDLNLLSGLSFGGL